VVAFAGSQQNVTEYILSGSVNLPDGPRVMWKQPTACRSIVIPRDLRYLTPPVEHSFSCPYCGEEISMVLDLSVYRHTYVEDCEVCCNPIEVTYTVQDDELKAFDAKGLE
jgi:cysteine-rich CPXCG protein